MNSDNAHVLLPKNQVPKNDAIQIERILNNAGCRLTSTQNVLFGWQIFRRLNSRHILQIAKHIAKVHQYRLPAIVAILRE